MTDKTRQHRTNRVFKSLHKPLTYLGVERTLFSECSSAKEITIDPNDRRTE
jgi:hypothetical protein